MLQSSAPKGFIYVRLLIIALLLTNAIPSTAQEGDTVTVTDSVSLANKDGFSLEHEVYRYAKDSIIADWKNDKIYLYNDAVIKYDEITLKADLIIYDLNSSVITATSLTDSLGKLQGKPIFSEGQEEFEADTIKYNFKTKRGVIKNVRTRVSEGYIDGELVVKNPDDILYIKDGRYCPCEDPDAHTKFKVTKIKVMEDLIVTGPGYLELAGIPTPILFPFGFFPNQKKRHAGIIIPTFGESPEFGFFLREGGFYLPIGDKLDMTLRGDIFSRGSWSVGSNFNYNNRYKYKGELDFSYSVFKRSDPEFPDYSEERNFWISWMHNQDPKANPNNRFNARINAGTSNNFVNTFNSTPANYLTNQFNSNINYTRLFPGKPFSLSIGASHSQNTRTGEVNVTLPNASFNVGRFYPFKWLNPDGTKRSKLQQELEKVGITYRIEGQNRATLNDTLININNPDYIFDNLRNGIKQVYNIQTSFRLWKKRLTLSPQASFTDRFYFSSITKKWVDSTRVIDTDTLSGFNINHEHSFSANLSTKLYGYYYMVGPKKRVFRHVMTPNIGFRYRNDFGSDIQLYGDDTLRTTYSPYDIGIYGKATAGRSGLVSIQIINTLAMKVREKLDSVGNAHKVSIIDNFNISTGYDMIKDSLNWSNININVATTLFDKVILNYSSTYDPYWYDENGTKRNQLLFDRTGKLARMTNTRLGAGFRLMSKKKNINDQFSEDEQDELQANNQNPYDYFDIPWMLNANYQINFNQRYFTEENIETGEKTVTDSLIFSQTIGLNGDFKLSPKWKIIFSTNYDIKESDFSYSNIQITRDLNCWEAAMTWVPLGPRRSYAVTIRLKNPLLKDVKYTRQRNWYDQAYF